MVRARLLQQAQRPHDGKREAAGQRLGVVVEVDEQALAVAALDEAVRVPVERLGHRPAGDLVEEVVDEDLDREVRHRAGLRRRDVGGVTDGEDVRERLGAQRPLVDRHVVELVAETRAGHEVRAHVERHRHQQVEGHLALVVGDQGLLDRVDALDDEVGLDADLALVEHRLQVLGRDRLGERAGQAASRT